MDLNEARDDGVRSGMALASARPYVFLKVYFVFLCFCVTLDYFGFMLLVLLGFCFFQYQANRLAEKNVY